MIEAFDFELGALSLDELLSSSYEPLPRGRSDSDLAAARLDAWCRVSADGDQSIFQRRLARDDLDLDMVRARLGGVQRRAGHPQPPWVGESLEVLETLQAPAVPPETSGLDGARLPFDLLLWPLVESAERTLRQSIEPAAAERIAAAAFADIRRHLARRLANFCELPLYQCLLEWRAPLLAAQARGEPWAYDALMSPTLAGFAAHMRAQGFGTLARCQPIVLRLMAALRRQWIQSYREMLERLARDRDHLSTINPRISSAATLTAVQWGHSDPHNGGRSVLVLVFDGRHRVVYKPKELVADRTVGAFLDVLRHLSLPIDLYVPRVLLRNGYGWAEFIDGEPCESESELAAYYRRAGAWLGVFHLLSASDMHMENIIARGAHPVPVDLETILQGLRQKPRAVQPDTEAAWMASAFLEQSVQSVGMLPTYIRTFGEQVVSVGALEPSRYAVSRIDWIDLNTPRMRLREAEQEMEISSNLPLRAGVRVGVGAYRDQFVEGFRALMTFVRTRQSAVLHALSELLSSAVTIRRVVRPTRFYYLILKRLYDPRKMHDSVSWSMEAEFIARLYDWDARAEEPWKVFAAERRQLLGLDIPFFTMSTRSNVISDAQGPVTRLHVELGPAVCLARSAQLSEQAIDAQVALIRAALQMEPRTRPAGRVHDADTVRSSPGDGAAPAALCSSLDAYIRSRAFRAERSLAWLGLDYLDREVATQIGVIGRDLYRGTAGIGIFFAALAVSGLREGARQDALFCLSDTQHRLRSAAAPQLPRAIGIGAGVGLGSLVYALATIGKLVGSDEAIDAALGAARLLSDSVIAADRQFDVIGGASGACLALLKLHEITGADWVLGRALACAGHLLANRPPAARSGIWSSETFEHRPLTGLAHGAAGYALAFSRLYRRSRDDRFRRVADDCIAFENATFDAALGNWPDLRGGERAGGSGPVQWCYGATGIGYARLSMVQDGCVASDVLQVDVRRAVAATQAARPYSNDTLCCGVAGHVDFLAEAATACGDAALLHDACTRLDEIAQRWVHEADIRWDIGSREFGLGLFRGIAGVGFVGLRTLDPSLPRVAVWD